jgi:osmoprotectant transport system substrate-binding protein
MACAGVRERHVTRRALVLFVLLIAIGCRERGERVVVGSKNFGEQVLLGEIAAQAIERSGGVHVERRFNLGGTFICDRALRSGDIDLYVEYSGTALTAILKKPPVSDPKTARDAVRSAYGAAGLEWMDGLGFENTFALVVRPADSERLRLARISDLAAHPELRPAFGYEFMEREDGFRGLARTYGIAFREPPKIMELGLLYRALAEQQADVVAGNSTDGVIDTLGLRVLEDDRRYFPPYEAAIVARRATLDRHPAVRSALTKLAGTITADTMRRMNARAESGGATAEEVARDFLDARGS